MWFQPNALGAACVCWLFAVCAFWRTILRATFAIRENCTCHSCCQSIWNANDDNVTCRIERNSMWSAIKQRRLTQGECKWRKNDDENDVQHFKDSALQEIYLSSRSQFFGAHIMMKSRERERFHQPYSRALAVCRSRPKINLWFDFSDVLVLVAATTRRTLILIMEPK